MQKIGLFLKDKNIGKNGSVVTTTFSIEQNDSEQIIDMEILVPLKEEQTFENGLLPITTGYNVNIKELKQGDSMDDMEMDIYIGVNPNIL